MIWHLGHWTKEMQGDTLTSFLVTCADELTTSQSGAIVTTHTFTVAGSDFAVSGATPSTATEPDPRRRCLAVTYTAAAGFLVRLGTGE